jgi:hypothetical protein
MRTIVVGDVHGCADELDALLDHVQFATGDRLVFVGDLVARGPASLKVLDIARATGALMVRGNHEQKLLDYDDARAEWIRGTPPASGTKTDIGKIHRDLARELRPIDWVMLRSSPIWLDLPEHELRIVHAGIDPSQPFEKQNPGTMMRIRTVPSAQKKPVLWGERYAGPPHILFGHNAAPGLQLHPWATGLDTACVYGGRLTALVLGPKQRVPRTLATRRAMIVSVPARKMWFEPSRGAA